MDITCLQVEIDGQVVATSDTLSRLSVNVTRVEPPDIDCPIAKSIQLGLDTEYPVGNVSVPNVDASDVHAVIDGRVWFYPEIQNWWDMPAGDGEEVWYEVNFGATVDVTRAEIAFAAVEEADVDVPESYRLKYLDGEVWVDVDVDREYEEAVGNWITGVCWAAVTTQKVRLVFMPKEGLAVRLVELKLF